MSQCSNSLKLLCDNYGSDTESDLDSQLNDPSNEVPEVSSKEEISKLPLPESIRNLYVACPEVVDDTELHGGRVRSFPHERGNWVTSIYISYDYSKKLNSICESLKKKCFEISDFHSCDEFHISLSRPVILRHHWIDLFVEDLKERLRNMRKFYVDVGELAIYVNEENTRTFVAFKIQRGCEELLKCIKLVDQSLLEFKLPTYYEDPSFHVSLIWCLGNKRKEIGYILPKIQADLDKINSMKSLLMHVNRISCKIGNRFYNFNLT